jgi:hypothetical protein
LGLTLRGSYVGETSSDDAIDAGETGAEARSAQKNRSVPMRRRS